ncbi:hypothetical protein Q8A73_002942 [Channa argus]|nr:hypothetical protein Q8A73_002942 [Channa argus]
MFHLQLVWDSLKPPVMDRLTDILPDHGNQQQLENKKNTEEPSEPEDRPDNREQHLPAEGQSEEQENLLYASVHFSKKETDAVYSNIRAAQPHKEEEEVTEYSAVRFVSKNPPQVPSVSVSPSAEIVEGSSVNLTCSSDANPAANYTWFKKNGNPDLQLISKQQLVFNSILSSDAGNYYCRAENKLGRRTSEYKFVNVEYPPQVPSVSVSPSAEIVEGSSVTLTCSSDANPAANYTWYKENEDSPKASGQIFTITDFRPEHSGNYSCEAQNTRGRHHSTLYLNVESDPPKLPSVSVSPSAEIVEGSSVTLTCSSDANPAANYTWYKKNQTVVNKENGNLNVQPLNQEPQLVFASIQSSDFGQYYCEAENELGRNRSGDISLNVKYPPQLPSVSVSPSAEIVEGSSVTLTCSTDANPAANYTWFKQKGPDPKYIHEKPQLVFRSIKSSASGHYYCTAENKLGRRTSEVVSINVKYPPQPPSVSVSPSAEIVEGSSVTLTCSSDANPAANYTWYKENEDSPKASGQIFTITDFRPEHSGNYYCEAQNTIGRQNSTLHLFVTTEVLLSLQCLPDQGQLKEQEHLQYASVQFSNIRAVQPHRHKEKEEVVEYTALRFNSKLNISCTYTSYYDVTSKFWFSPERSRQWQNPSQPEDLSKDSQYSGRVQVFETETGRSTLRITDLRETDSAQYHFKFITQSFEWRSSLPGTTLTVTALHVQVIRSTVHQFYTEAELKCLSSKSPTGRLTFVWFNNGQKINKMETASYKGQFNPGDHISCALKEHEDCPSPPVCVRGESRNRVIYTDRRICVFKGSSVDISCTYTSYYQVKSKFWFSPERSRQWQNPSQPEGETGRSTLRITDLRETDSAQYHFKFITQSFEWRSSLPGTTLTVTALQVQVIRSTVHQFYTEAELKCLSSKSPTGRLTFVWFNNGQKINKMETASYKGQFNPGDHISCALKEHEDCPSPPVYPPQLPSVSVSPSAEIVEGSSVTVTCSSDANPAANYTWYKKNQTVVNKKNGNLNVQPLNQEPQLVFVSIQSSDSGQYYCEAENKLGRNRSGDISLNVKYPPQLPSVSVSPSAEIVEGSSVTLTCSSDANPAANYTWYKQKGPDLKYSHEKPQLVFRSIKSSASGQYYCTAENKLGRRTSEVVSINVKYPPQLPSVSVSPSAEIVEGSSVTLTCSSDANPAANYTWYKENEDSPKASGQIFTITDIKPEHSGNYSCEAQNTKGRQNATLYLIVAAGSWKSAAARVTTAVLLLLLVLCVFLWIRNKKNTEEPSEPEDRPDNREQVRVVKFSFLFRLCPHPQSLITKLEAKEPQISENQLLFTGEEPACRQHLPAEGQSEEPENLLYASVNFSKKETDAVYSNIRAAQPHKEEEEVTEYSAVRFVSKMIKSQNDWRVSYTSTQICGIKGSTVDINCTYTYPSRMNNINTAVNERLWFTKGEYYAPVDLLTDSDYTGRVRYHCENNTCTLTITDLRLGDSAVYKFRFTTNQPEGSYTGLPGVTLSVTDLQMQVIRSERRQDSTWAEVKCQSSCLPDNPTFIWYKNGQKIWRETTSLSHEDNFSSTDSYSCAVKGHEKFPSPPVYPPQVPSVSVSPSAEMVEGSSVNLTCSSDANPAANYTWYKENEDSPKASGQIFTITDFRPEHSGNYSCEAQNTRGRHHSTLYLNVESDPPKLPSVSVSPSAEIVEGSSVTLTCSSDANPAANYTWYKKNQTVVNKENGNLNVQPLNQEPQLVFASIQSSDFGQYYCEAENELGRNRSGDISLNVKYPPQLPSVSVSPSAEIVEGSSVTLTCSTDANPAANYTWFKQKGPDPKYIHEKPQLVFRSIKSSASGHYYCTAENKLGRRTSEVVSINVKYPPQPPSVSVSPSAEIVEGSSVTLTCSSDANPAANYTWYKENEDSPKASGQIFTITDFRPEHSGNYYCEAQNTIGRQNSTLHLFVTKTGKSTAAGVTTAVLLLLVIFFFVFLWIRKKRTNKHLSEPDERPENREQRPPDQGQSENPQYTTVHFFKEQTDPVYYNIRAAQPHRHMEEDEVTEYSAIDKLMTVIVEVVPLALLHMWPVQRFLLGLGLRPQGSHHTIGQAGCHAIYRGHGIRGPWDIQWVSQHMHMLELRAAFSCSPETWIWYSGYFETRRLEPLSHVGLEWLSLKTALLLSMSSAKRKWELNFFFIHLHCCKCLSGSPGIVPNSAFLSNSLSEFHLAQSIELQVLLLQLHIWLA